MNGSRNGGTKEKNCILHVMRVSWTHDLTFFVLSTVFVLSSFSLFSTYCLTFDNTSVGRTIRLVKS